MLRGGDQQTGGGRAARQSVSSTMAGSDAMSDGGGFGGPGNGGFGSGGSLASLIAAPPEGWQSQKGIYDQAGFGNGWLYGNNQMENADAYAHTKAGPQMPYGIDPFTDIEYGPGSGQEGQTSGFHLVNRGEGPGPDLFGGHQFKEGNLPRYIPQELQPWLAPALMKYFYQSGYANQGGSGMNAPWTGQYAPRAPDIKTWPGITKYDPWGRSMGEIANAYN
jgi:hypothetical protein